MLEEISYLSSLAKIRLSPEESQNMALHLQKMLEYCSQIQQVDTTDIPPMYHPIDVINHFREDSPGNPLSQETVLKKAPHSQKSHFTVPKVLEK